MRRCCFIGKHFISTSFCVPLSLITKKKSKTLLLLSRPWGNSLFFIQMYLQKNGEVYSIVIFLPLLKLTHIIIWSQLSIWGKEMVHCSAVELKIHGASIIKLVTIWCIEQMHTRLPEVISGPVKSEPGMLSTIWSDYFCHHLCFLLQCRRVHFLQNL